MKALFVDTAGWMACADASDRAHVRCCAARDGALEARQMLVTTDFVVDETLTLLRFRLGLSAAEKWWHQVDRSSRLRWERIDSDRFEKARQLFFEYRDKDFFSFTDCTSETPNVEVVRACTLRPTSSRLSGSTTAGWAARFPYVPRR